MATINVVITPEGKVSIAVPEGVTFEVAAAKIKQLAKDLGIEGLPIVLEGEPEQHKHEQEDPLRVTQRQRASF